MWNTFAPSFPPREAVSQTVSVLQHANDLMLCRFRFTRRPGWTPTAHRRRLEASLFITCYIYNGILPKHSLQRKMGFLCSAVALSDHSNQTQEVIFFYPFSSVGCMWNRCCSCWRKRVEHFEVEIILSKLFILHSLAPSLPATVFLTIISKAHLSLPLQNLRKMEEESSEEPGRDLNELQNADWVGL